MEENNNQIPETPSPAQEMPRQSFYAKNKELVFFWLDVFLNIVIIVASVFLIRTFIISPFVVSGPSMCDTLNNINGVCQKGNGEFIIVNKFGYQNFLGLQVGLPQRGDIIVFHPPENPSEFFIKRVIGLPKETVKLENGEVKIYNKEHPEGWTLDEPYLNKENSHNTIPVGGIATFNVPDGHYFVLGDNRVVSSDSRTCFRETLGGERCGQGKATPFLPYSNIEGRAWVILWPFNKISSIQRHSY